MSEKKINTEKLLARGVEAIVPTIVDEEHADIQLVSEGDLADVASNEAFMNERVKIRLATTTDLNAPPYAIVTVNSAQNRVVIPRGEVVDVKRMHVEILARMRETRYTQPFLTNLNDVEKANHLVARHSMVYPFEVIEDKNPKGRAWLENILAEPAY